MKRTFPILIWMLIYLLGGCSNPDKESIEITPIKVLKIHNMDMADKISTFNDSIIILSNTNVSPFFTLINTKDGGEVAHFGEKGMGPGELIWPKLITTDTCGILVNDISLGKIYNFQNVLSDNPIVNSKQIIDSSRGVTNHILHVNDTLMILDKLATDNRFTWLANDTTSIPVNIEYPINKNEVSAKQASLIFQGDLLHNPYEHLFIHLSRYGKVFEIFKYNPESKQIEKKFQKIDSLPVFDIDDDQNSLSSNINKETIIEVV